MTNTSGARVVDLPRKDIEFLLPLRSQYSYNRSVFENGWKMNKQFMDLLFGGYRRQVLGLLLLRPDDSLYVRQIARLTGVPPGSLHRELQSLASAGILFASRRETRFATEPIASTRYMLNWRRSFARHPGWLTFCATLWLLLAN